MRTGSISLEHTNSAASLIVLVYISLDHCCYDCWHEYAYTTTAYEISKDARENSRTYLIFPYGRTPILIRLRITFQNFLELSRTFQSFLEHSRIFWNVLTSENFLELSECARTFENNLELSRTIWNYLVDSLEGHCYSRTGGRDKRNNYGRCRPSFSRTFEFQPANFCPYFPAHMKNLKLKNVDAKCQLFFGLFILAEHFDDILYLVNFF